MTTLPSGTAQIVARNLTPEPERELPQDPVRWHEQELGGHLWSKQRLIARSVLANRYTAVHAASGLGKSYDAAVIACWWIEGHPPGEAIVVSSAPTDDLVGDVLWGEIRRLHQRGALIGRTNLANEWYLPGNPEALVGMGRKSADLANPDQAMARFSGRHARYVLVILDEAVGIPEWLYDAADTLVTNEASRILAIGNPDDPTSHFERICRPGSGWNVIGISAFDSPNITGEPVPEYLREELPSRTWIEERAARWGKESARYKSRVLGEFPDTSDVNVISPALVVRAQQNALPGMERGAYGLDVARFGHDRTVLYRSRGGVVRLEDQWAKADTVATTRRTLGQVMPEVPIVVDADGIGGGVYDQLRAAGAWVVPFTAQDKVRNPRRFHNRRSELWWTYREVMEDGLIDLDPGDEDLASQLQAPRWGYDGRGRIRVETKEEMAKRGIPSPDRADACIMAELGAPAEGVRPPGQVDPQANGRKMETAGLRTRAM